MTFKKKQKLTIAVVLVSYNQEKYILQALEGIQSQTRKPDEVVIADDGSSDSTQQRIHEFIERNGLRSKWVLLFSNINRGININFQNAVDHTTSEIIIPMAGDDISLPNRCADTEKLFLRYPGFLLIALSGYLINDKGDILRQVTRSDRIVRGVAGAIRRGNPKITPMAQAMRREIMYQYGILPHDLPNEDDQISFRGLISGGIVCSSIKAVKYRIHADSASAWLHRQQSREVFLDRFKKDLLIRERHMRYWSMCLQHSKLRNKDTLADMANLKADFYKHLCMVDRLSFLKRLKLAIEFLKIISFKDAVYCLFGSHGIFASKTFRYYRNFISC